MNEDLHMLFAALWRDYVSITPQAKLIHRLFEARGERIINDHVALRTYARAGLGVDALARPFVALGYAPFDSYVFPNKHLRARAYRHADRDAPKVFISELDVDALSEGAQAAIDTLMAALPPGFAERGDLPSAGRVWPVSHATYRSLLAESEYAAWVAAFGLHVNHFTIDVGRLESVSSLTEVVGLVAAAGFELNEQGGVIKGSPAERLEQASTRAGMVEVAFEDGVHRIPSCYYEFARRYPLPSGERFEGFIAASADKLFHSTDAHA